MIKTVCLSSFRKNATSDTAAFAAATEYLRENPNSTLVIEPGVYEITTDLAVKTMNECIAGEYGSNPEPVMFSPKFPYSRGIDFDGIEGATVEGYGATILVYGFMEPISLRNCSNITLKGITVDHKRKPFSVGIITEVEENAITVRFGDEYSITPKAPKPRYVLYDKKTNLFDHFIRIGSCKEVIDEHTFKFKCSRGANEANIGKELILCHTYHTRPAILIENAYNTVLKDVTIHNQPGMGIVGHRSENVLLSGLRVVPAPGYHMSTNTDATHFTSCKGTVRFEYCTFDSQGDDATNVHTYYHSIKDACGNRCKMVVEAPTGTHSQTLDYPDVGDTLELTCASSLAVERTYKVVSCIPHPEEWYAEVELDDVLPENTEGYLLADVTRLPRLEFVYSNCRNHFARSVLCKTRGALIENNTFVDTDGIAVEVAAESWWKEGVCSSDVIIRRNRMINCRWGGVEVKMDADEPHGTPQKNVLIEDNIVDCPRSPHGITVRNTENGLIRRNTVFTAEEPYLIKDCKNVTLES